MSTTATYTGARVLDEHGNHIGDVRDAIFDGAGDTPTWLVVKPGLLRAEHYMPARGAYRTESDDLVVPYTKDQVNSAPKAKGDHSLTHDQRAKLTQHYHLDTSTEG